MTSAPAASAPASAPRLAAGEIPGWTTSVTGLTAASEYRDALDVDELAEAVFRQLAAVARPLDASERQPRVRPDLAVHEDAARLDLAGEPLRPAVVARPERRPEAVRGVVAERDGLRFVPGPDHGRDRAEGLLVERRHPPADGDEHGRRIERARRLRHPSAEHDLGATPHRLLHLAVEVIAQVVACLRTDLRLGAERIPHPPRSHVGHEQVEEGLGHRVDDDEALGGDAALAVVDEARLGGGARGSPDVGVPEDDERVAPAELEHGLLELAPGLLRDAAPGAVAARQRDAAHARIGDDGSDPFGPDEHRAEDTFGKARFPEDLLDLERAARHVRGMLQDPRIAGDKRRG